MKYIVKTIYVIFSVFLVIYLLLPNIGFPKELPDSLQSGEPADIEDDLRRSYFTNFERHEVIGHYISNFYLYNVNPLRLNYPPEEAQSIIRDQTRSTFLEEIAFPLRESIYINGFKPTSAKDAVIIDNKVWVQKVTIKHVYSSVWERFLIGFAIILILPIIFNSLMSVTTNIMLEVKRNAFRVYK